MRKLVVILALALAGGCAAHGVDGTALPGTWALTQGTATASYTFAPDARMTFDGGDSAAGTHVHLQGAWFVDGATLTLAFDGGPTADVAYSIDGDKLTIVDDPATVRVGTHASVVYTRVAAQ